MRIVSLVSAWLACARTACWAHASTEVWRSSRVAARRKPLPLIDDASGFPSQYLASHARSDARLFGMVSLQALLLALNPEAAFRHSGQGASSSIDLSALSRFGSTTHFQSTVRSRSLAAKWKASAPKSRTSREIVACARWDRRGFVSALAASIAFFAPRSLHQGLGAQRAEAFIAGTDEEISGLVVLRVAEVCAFQEKLLRALASCSAEKSPAEGSPTADQFGNSYCTGTAYSVNPNQIIYGTELLLKNSKLGHNLQLMIDNEIVEEQKYDAMVDAGIIMTDFNNVVKTAFKYKADLTGDGYVALANDYSKARQNLARFFDYLPQEAKDKFYGYAEDVRKYEEKVSREDGIERMKL